METLIINFKSKEFKDEVINAFCSEAGYRPEIDKKPNPETKEEFVIKRIQDVMRRHLNAARAKEASRAVVKSIREATKAEDFEK